MGEKEETVLQRSEKAEKSPSELLSDRPIGFMDSGLGGLSVLKEALAIMPAEDFIYFGDSKNAPYGTKSEGEIRALTFAVVEKLLSQGIKGLAVACNTATASAVKQLRIAYPDLAIVGIEPAIKPAVQRSHGGRILVMATPMTIAMEKYHRLLQRFGKNSDIVSVPCAGLMEFVEEGDFLSQDLDPYFEEHLSPYLTENVETIVLGCTHYPFIRPQLQSFLDRVRSSDLAKIRIIDGSLGTAKELRRRLQEKDLLRKEDRKGEVIIQNSLENEVMIERSRKLLRRETDTRETD
ncbi:MAG: glutamate racemase [Lachnospiraceae bacterium]|nr:glutamate racemase [Lachnospiraceae bacterium]